MHVFYFRYRDHKKIKQAHEALMDLFSRHGFEVHIRSRANGNKFTPHLSILQTKLAHQSNNRNFPDNTLRAINRMRATVFGKGFFFYRLVVGVFEVPRPS